MTGHASQLILLQYFIHRLLGKISTTVVLLFMGQNGFRPKLNINFPTEHVWEFFFLLALAQFTELLCGTRMPAATSETTPRDRFLSAPLLKNTHTKHTLALTVGHTYIHTQTHRQTQSCIFQGNCF